MKAPKTNKPLTKDKFNGPKSGKIKKSVGKEPSKLTALSSLKNADQALSLIKSNAGNVSIKASKKQGKDKISNSLVGSPSQNNGLKSMAKKKFPKSKKVKSLVVNDVDKPSMPKLKNKLLLKCSPIDEENNSSPIKFSNDKKNIKIPFQLEDSLTILTPTKSKKSNNKSPQSNNSPEVILGLQLEKALSPKSAKAKRKLAKQKLQQEGKIEVNKKNDAEAGTAENKSGKKKKRPRKKPKKSDKGFSLFHEINAKNALGALLKTSNNKKEEKTDLFGEDKFIYLQCNLHKGSPKSQSLVRALLPHSILPESPEICLITADLKGKRNDPDEAIDYYKDLLQKSGIDIVTEIVPIRKLKREYPSFEQRRNMANRFDAVLTDGRIGKFASIGKRFSSAKMCIASIHFGRDLKTEFDKATRKVVMFSNGRGLSLSIKCGRLGMSINDISENIVAIGKQLALAKILIGDPNNIASVYVKSALSPSFPVYISLLNPNNVSMPEGKKRKVEEPVEGELSTLIDASVVVHPSGAVKVKKQKTGEEDNKLSKKQAKVERNKQLLKDKQKQQLKQSKKASKKDESDSESDDLDSEIEDVDSEDSDLGSEIEDEAGSEVEDDDDVDEDEDDDEEDDEVEEAEDDDQDNSASDSDEFEDQITAAEIEYLQEVRKMQDVLAKNKKNISKGVNKEQKHEIVNKEQKQPRNVDNKQTVQIIPGNKKNKKNKNKQGNDQKKPEKQAHEQNILGNIQVNQQKKQDIKQANVQKKQNNKQGLQQKKVGNQQINEQKTLGNKQVNQQKKQDIKQVNVQKKQDNKQGLQQKKAGNQELNVQNKQDNKQVNQQKKQGNKQADGQRITDKQTSQQMGKKQGQFQKSVNKNANQNNVSTKQTTPDKAKKGGFPGKFGKFGKTEGKPNFGKKSPQGGKKFKSK